VNVQRVVGIRRFVATVRSAVRSWQEDDDETNEPLKRSGDGLTPRLWIAFIVSAARRGRRGDRVVGGSNADAVSRHPSPPVL